MVRLVIWDAVAHYDVIVMYSVSRKLCANVSCIDGVQFCRNSSALVMELLQFCTKQSTR